MAKTRSMTRKENHDSSGKKRFKTCDSNATWSDLNHDLLFLVMMRLGIVDFLAFGGVCKSWRSFALSNRNKFILFRPPMSLSIPKKFDEIDYYCYLGEDLDGRRFKTLIPHSSGRTYIGFTCGYLVLFGRETRDFWLVNPITRHELHFPDIPSLENNNPTRIRAKLVFSPSLSGLVLVVLNTFTKKILFYVAGTRSWNHVTSSISLYDLLSFKGKIYTITTCGGLCELRLDPEPKLTLLKFKNNPKLDLTCVKFVTYDENLYVMIDPDKDVWELDFSEMKWVSPKKTGGIYDFMSRDMFCFGIRWELWADPRSKYERYMLADRSP